MATLDGLDLSTLTIEEDKKSYSIGPFDDVLNYALDDFIYHMIEKEYYTAIPDDISIE
jgi:hypothetical protein